MDLQDNTTIEALRTAGATTAELRKATLLTNDVKRAMIALNDESTPTNRKNYSEAETAQAEYVGGLVARYLDTSPAKEEDDHFPHKLAAWEYLRDSGWKIGRSQFYEHCKQGRLPFREGKYLRRDVDRYAAIHCKSSETGEKVNDTLSRMAEEKATTELEREKVRLKREQHELAVRLGEVVPRDEVELMIIGRAVAMLSHLKAMVQMGANDWIALVEGDQRRSRELIDTIVASIEERVAIFARDIEFEVILEKNNQEETHVHDD
ncbi:MAG: hypothetical protein EOL86_09155 [Deltaproteobacteria bacterium]|nr:hypothetical protein [Deltaproteobacteria bacterium]